MPLIVICGTGLSGKTCLTQKISNYLKEKHEINAIIISDEIKLNELKRNVLYNNSSIEKQLRGWLKSEVERHVSADNLVILDANNGIKGFRYELYCSSKERKTTHCVIDCLIPSDIAWNRNESRECSDKYSKETFDALIQRYEAPDSRNRWDSPLFAINFNDDIPYDKIMAALYARSAPKPNQSTQSQPLSSTNFVYELDCKTQQVIQLILNSIQSGQLTNIVIPKAKQTVNMKRPLTIAELSKLKRQFINYTKMHPISDNELIVSLFVQFINKSI